MLFGLVKKIFLGIFCILLFQANAFAANYKFTAELVEPFSTENPPQTVKFRVIDNYYFSDGRGILKDTLVNANVIAVEPARRGKRDAHVLIKIMEYKIPGSDEGVVLQNSHQMAKITKYKPFDHKNAALSAGTTVAGFFVKNIAYPINFARGVVEADEDESKLQSGVQNAYEQSMFGYISPGKELDLQSGAKVTITVQ